MGPRDLQLALQKLGYYHGDIDGRLGPLAQAAILAAASGGPDTRLTDADVQLVANLNGIEAALIKTVFAVEAASSGFNSGRATLLFEPHRFSRATGHRFDHTNPVVSYANWGDRPYPKLPAARWNQLVAAVCLDVDAGFGSASYGAFQILGENFAACGFDNSFSFFIAMAQTEGAQLQAFIKFIVNNKLIGKLKAKDWAGFARGYNGTAFAKNEYDTKLAHQYALFSKA